MQYLFRLIAVVFGLALAILIAEVGLRLAPLSVARQVSAVNYDTRAVDAIAAGHAYLTFDRDLGWIPTPDYDAVQDADGPQYRHSAQGLRADRAYFASPPPGITRFTAYGDSFTYCRGVNFEDCWTQQLERLLPDTEVINSGVPGYGLDQAWLRYQRDGSAWQPCAVLIGNFLDGINRLLSRFRPFRFREMQVPLGKPRYFVENGYLQLLPNPAARAEDLKDEAWVQANLATHDAQMTLGGLNPLDSLRVVGIARATVGRASPAPPEKESRQDLQSYRTGTEAFEVLVRVLVGFAEQVRAENATPVVLLFPGHWEIERQRDGVGKVYAPVLRELRRRGIPTVDLNDVLGQEAHRTRVSELAPAHYSRLGNAVVARALAERLPRLTAKTCKAHRQGF
jgi:hypothetical protein